MGKYVQVPIKRYLELEEAESHLLALEAEGVDNWPGYEECEVDEFTEDMIMYPITEE